MVDMMEKYTNQLEEMVEDRTRQLADEKKRTDELLYQILPRFAFHDVLFLFNKELLAVI